MAELIVPAEEAVSRIAPGSVVGIAGPYGERRPLALVRALARRRVTGLRLVAWADGAEATMLDAPQLEVVRAEAFRAAGLGLDFFPVVPDDARSGPTVTSPITGAVYGAIPALRPDVVLLHAEAADEHGTVLLAADPSTWSNDRDLVASAPTIIVSVERLVSPLAASGRARDRLIEPGRVAAIVHAPFGSHPLPYPGEYPADDSTRGAPPVDADHWAYLD